MRLSGYVQQARASMEAAAMEEIRQELESGELSDSAMEIADAEDRQAENVNELIEATHDAKAMHSDLAEMYGIESRFRELHHSMEQINNHQGFKRPWIEWAENAANHILRPLEVNVSLASAGTPSLESADQTQVSLEGIEQILVVLSETRENIEEGSVDAVLRVMDTLEEVLPEVRDRVHALHDYIDTLSYNEEMEIRVDEAAFKALQVHGNLPVTWKDYFASYSGQANAILGTFTANALESASKGQFLADCMHKYSGQGPISNALVKAMADIGDPRKTISVDNLCFILPGSGPLFGNKVAALDEVTEVTAAAAVAPPPTRGDGSVADTEVDAKPKPSVEADASLIPEVSGLITRLEKFSTDYVPLEPLAWDDIPAADEKNSTIRALSKDTIKAVTGSLIQALEVNNIRSFAESHRATWYVARSAPSAFADAYNELSPQYAVELSPALAAIYEYLDTLYTLSVWPALHMMLNTVFTANAFLVVAERSISGKSAKVTPENSGSYGAGEVDGARKGIAPDDANDKEVAAAGAVNEADKDDHASKPGAATDGSIDASITSP